MSNDPSSFTDAQVEQIALSYGMTVPTPAELQSARMSRRDFILTNKSIQDKKGKAPLHTPTATTTLSSSGAASHALAAGAIVQHKGRTIKVPPAETLSFVNMTPEKYVETQKLMIDQGVL